MSAPYCRETLDHLGYRAMCYLLAVLWQSSILFVATAGLAWLLRRVGVGLFPARMQIGRRIAALLTNPLSAPSRLSPSALTLLVVLALAALSFGVGVNRAESPIQWGKEVQGAQCRLRLGQESYRGDLGASFRADVRIPPSHFLRTKPTEAKMEYCLDGKWNSSSWYGSGVPAEDGTGFSDLRIALYETPIKSLLPKAGSHTVQVAISLYPKNVADAPIRVISNTIRFEVQPAKGIFPMFAGLERSRRPLAVTPAQLRSFYDQNPEFFTKPMEVVVKRIYTPTLDKAREAEARARKGEDFDTLIAEYFVPWFAEARLKSGGPNKSLICSGWESRWQLPEPENLPVGEIGKPFHRMNLEGFFVSKVVAERHLGLLPFEEVSDGIFTRWCSQLQAYSAQKWPLKDAPFISCGLDKERILKLADLYLAQAKRLHREGEWAGTAGSALDSLRLRSELERMYSDDLIYEEKQILLDLGCDKDRLNLLVDSKPAPPSVAELEKDLADEQIMIEEWASGDIERVRLVYWKRIRALDRLKGRGVTKEGIVVSVGPVYRTTFGPNREPIETTVIPAGSDPSSGVGINQAAPGQEKTMVGRNPGDQPMGVGVGAVGVGGKVYYEQLIEKNPYDPNVPSYLTHTKEGAVSNGYVGKSHPLSDKIKALYRERLKQSLDPQIASSLASIIQTQLWNTDLGWSVNGDGGCGHWQREDPAESYATLAEALDFGFRHIAVRTDPWRDLWSKMGVGLAKLRLLQGDWEGMNAMLAKLGQQTIPSAERPWLHAPPKDWSNLRAKWGQSDPAMRSGQCGLELRFEKDGRGLAGVHVLIKETPKPNLSGVTRLGERADTLFLSPNPLATGPGWGVGDMSFGYLADQDRTATRYAVSDTSGIVRFERLPEIPVIMEVLVPTGNFAETARDWELALETSPGHLQRAAAATDFGTKNPAIVWPHDPAAQIALKSGETVRYPKMVVRLKPSTEPAQAQGDEKQPREKEQGKPANDAVEKYGEHSSPPISNGFFFDKGKYVEAPYLVKRVGLAVYINGHLVEPGYDEPDWRIYQDPGPAPDSVTPWDERKNEASWTEGYWSRKWRYLNTVMDHGRAKARMFEALGRIPGVTRISWGKEGTDDVIITDSSGTERTVSLAQMQPWRPKEPEYLPNLPGISPRDSRIERSEGIRRQCEDRLKTNTLLLNVLGGSGLQYIPEAGAIPAIRAVLEGKTPEDMIAAPNELGLVFVNAWRERIENLQVGNREELSARLLRITEERAKRIRDKPSGVPVSAPPKPKQEKAKAAAAQEQSRSAKDMVEKYGESSGPPINNGFFFHDGKYVEAPYVVKRVGLDIYVNEYLVDPAGEPFDWRLYQDPGPPPDNVAPWDKPKSGTDLRETYWSRKWRYLNTVMDHGKARTEMSEALRKIPGVRLSWSDGDHLTIADSSGTERMISLLPAADGHQYWPRLDPVLTKSEVIGRREQDRQVYESYLTRNVLFLNSTEPARRQDIWEEKGISAIEVMLSSETPREKMAAFRGLGVIFEGAGREGMDYLQIGNREELSARLLRITKEQEQEKAKHTRDMVEKYGENSGPPISNGFFFYKGKYVEAPYVVKRVGLEIYINSHRVERGYEPFDWRIYEDPGPVPDNLKPWDKWCGIAGWSESYWPLKWRYLNTVMDHEKAKAQVFELLSKMPGVAKLSWGKREDLVVTDSSGTERRIPLSLIQPVGDDPQYLPNVWPLPTKEELVARSETKRLGYENDLKANTLLLDAFEGGPQQGIGGGAAIAAIEIILKSKSPEDTVAALEAIGVIVQGAWRKRMDYLQVGNREELSARLARITGERAEKQQDQKSKEEMSRLRTRRIWEEVVGRNPGGSSGATGVESRGGVGAQTPTPSLGLQEKEFHPTADQEALAKLPDPLDRRMLEHIPEDYRSERPLLEALLDLQEEEKRPNALLRYEAAHLLAPDPPSEAQIDLIQTVPSSGWSGKAEILKPYLEAWRPAFEQIRKGLALDYAKGVVSQRPDALPDTIAVRRAAKALCVEGRYFESLGRNRDALENYLAVVAMGRDYMSPGNSLTPPLTGFSAVSVGTGQIRALVTTGKLTLADLERCRTRLEAIDRTCPTLEEPFRFEGQVIQRQVDRVRGEIDDMRKKVDAENATAGSKIPPEHAEAVRQAAKDLDRYEAYQKKHWDFVIRNAKLPWWERDKDEYKKTLAQIGQELEQIKQERMRETFHLSNPTGILMGISFHNLPEADARRCRARAGLCLARVATGLEIYKAANGRYPASLDALTPAQVGTEPPVDPFSGKPLRYRLDGDRYALWSIGPDSADNAAETIYDPTNGTMSRGDIILKLSPAQTTGSETSPPPSGAMQEEESPPGTEKQIREITGAPVTPLAGSEPTSFTSPSSQRLELAKSQASRMAERARREGPTLRPAALAGINLQAEAPRLAAAAVADLSGDRAALDSGRQTLRYLKDLAFDQLVVGLRSEASRTKTDCADFLADLGEKGAAPLIEALPRITGEADRASMVRALGSIRSQAALPTLVGALSDPSQRVREAAAESVLWYRDATSVEMIGDIMLRSNNARFIEQAAALLTEAFPEAAARILPKIAARKDLPTAVGSSITTGTLRQRLQADLRGGPRRTPISDDAQHTAILQLARDALTYQGESFGEKEIDALLGSMHADIFTVNVMRAGQRVKVPSDGINRAVLGALAHLRASRAPEAILREFPDNRAALSYLSRFPEEEAVRFFFPYLTSDKSDEVSFYTGSLGMGGDWTAPLLFTLLDNPNLKYDADWTRDAIRSLGGDPGQPYGPTMDHYAHWALEIWLRARNAVGGTSSPYWPNSPPFDLNGEIEKLRRWWAKNGENFVAGKPVTLPTTTRLSMDRR